MLREEFYETRSQDLPNVYRDAAMFYFGRAEAWVEKRMIFSNRSEIVEIPEERGIDVDTLEDWDKMERAICHKLPDAICKKPL
jgi:N-acylneuraminate cytidylyltransferase